MTLRAYNYDRRTTTREQIVTQISAAVVCKLLNGYFLSRSCPHALMSHFSTPHASNYLQYVVEKKTNIENNKAYKHDCQILIKLMSLDPRIIN